MDGTLHRFGYDLGRPMFYLSSPRVAAAVQSYLGGYDGSRGLLYCDASSTKTSVLENGVSCRRWSVGLLCLCVTGLAR